MSEASQRQNLCNQLSDLDAIPVENRVRAGTPDINYRDGWIELKWARSWPVKPDTPAKIDHFNKAQGLWGRRRWRAKGRSFLLLQVQHEWLLFDGATAYKYVGKVPRADLYTLALRHWENGMDYKELVIWLTMEWPELERLRKQRGLSSAVAAKLKQFDLPLKIGELPSTDTRDGKAENSQTPPS